MRLNAEKTPQVAAVVVLLGHQEQWFIQQRSKGLSFFNPEDFVSLCDLAEGATFIKEGKGRQGGNMKLFGPDGFDIDPASPPICQCLCPVNYPTAAALMNGYNYDPGGCGCGCFPTGSAGAYMGARDC
jgi:hypothetical protein